MSRTRAAAALACLGVLSGCTAGHASAPASHATSAAGSSTAAVPSAQRTLTISVRTLSVAVNDPDVSHRAVVVLTPDLPDADTLPVVYLLHGLPGTAAQMCDTATVTALQTAFRAGARPFVLACPDGNPTENADSEWSDSVDGKDLLEQFVTVQAREAVEGTHPRPASERAIVGFSMGGFGAAAIALRHPTLYHQVGMLAGYVQLDDPDEVLGTTEAQRDQHDPVALVHNAKGQRWFLAEASGDTLALTRHAAEGYRPLLVAAGASTELVVTPGTHGTPWAIAQLPAVARWFSPGWPAS